MKKIKNNFKVGEVFEGKFSGNTYSLTDFTEKVSNLFNPIMQSDTTISTITKIECMTKQDFNKNAVELFITNSVHKDKGLIVIERNTVDGYVHNIIEVPTKGSFDSARMYANELNKVVAEGHVIKVNLIYLFVEDIKYDDLLVEGVKCPSIDAVLALYGLDNYDEPYRIKLQTDLCSMRVDSLGGLMTVAFGIARHGKFTLEIEVPWSTKEEQIKKLMSLGFDAEFWLNSKPHTLLLDGDNITDTSLLINENVYLSKTIYEDEIPSELREDFDRYVNAQITHVESLVAEKFGDLGEGIMLYSLNIEGLENYFARDLDSLINYVAPLMKQLNGNSIAIEVLKNYKTLSYLTYYIPYHELASLTEQSKDIYLIKKGKYAIHDMFLQEVQGIEHKDGKVKIYLNSNHPLNENFNSALKPFKESFHKYMGGSVGLPNQYVEAIITNYKEDFLDPEGVQADDRTTIKIVATDINGYGLYHLYDNHPKHGGTIFHTTSEPITTAGENYATVGSTSRDINEIYRKFLSRETVNEQSQDKNLATISTDPLT